MQHLTRRVLVCVAIVLSVQSLALQGQEKQPQPTTRSSGHINFSFDKVDVKTFVELVGRITGRKFVVADDIDRKITVVSPLVTADEVYPLFISILESAGCSVVQDGRISRIVALPRREIPVVPVVGVREKTPANGVVTKIFHLQNVAAKDVAKLISSKVGGSAKGAVGAIEETNHLLVTDTAESIRRIAKIVAEIDKPGLARVTEVVPLTFAGAEDLAEQLNRAVAEVDTRARRLRNRLPAAPGTSVGNRKAPVIVASPHSNSLILVGVPSQIIQLRELVRKMDVDAPSGRGRLNAIFLKYIPAVEAAKSISALLEKSYGKTNTRNAMRRISIEASAANNALLVDAMPGDFDVVKRLVDQLDQMPEQVHIDVVIAEHSINDDLDIGVEIVALEMPSKVGDTTIQGGSTFSSGADSLMNMIQAGMFPGGITIGMAAGRSVDANGNISIGYPAVLNINAMKRNGKIRIRSETSLETQNNREATVSIVNEIPILKSTIQGGSGTARDIIQNIERIAVGVKLKLTPRVVPGGHIQMSLNTSIEAVIDTGLTGAQLTPTIARREVSTTVTVPNGRTIIIAGLTREDTAEVVKKVPILGSIPVIGILFRRTIKSYEKSNIVILVTPRIVTSISEAEAVMSDWHKKTGL